MFDKVCLIGNPNCGKTTLFNILTGKNERVGNRAGVSVESKIGRYRKDKSVSVIDLPGTYSLKSASDDEKVVTDFLKDFSGVIVNVADGMNLERSFRLTAELTRLKIPMVIAINYCDETEKKGIKINVKALEEQFGVPVLLISARKNIGIDRLMAAVRTANGKPRPVPFDAQEKFISETFIKTVTEKADLSNGFSDKADKILMHKYFGIPVFAVIMVAVYFLTSVVGGFFGDKISQAIETAANAAEKSMLSRGLERWFIGLISGAIIRGVGEVLSFLPQVLVLFFLLSVLEETGYLARAAFLFDGIMEKSGLGGKSLIALGVSCGCTVSGIMTTRTIEYDNTKKLTVYLCPFMPCGAKTAVFAWFSGLIFGGNPFITVSLYFLSVFMIVVCGTILKKFARFRGGGGLIMEIPVLRFPSIRGLFGAIKEKTADFLLKAGSVIFIVSVAVWFLQSFGISGYTDDVTESFLFILGDKLKYLFIPLGFGNWQSSVAVIASVFAKEAVIQTLSMVSEYPAALFNSGYSAYAFMVFVLLMPPCVAALATAKNELQNNKEFCLMLVFQFSTAYLTAFIINVCGILTEKFGYVFLSLTIIAVGVIISVIILKHRRCGDCRACGGGKCRKKKVNTTI